MKKSVSQIPGSSGSNGRSSPKPVPILLTVRELDHGGIERDVTKIALQLDRKQFQPHGHSFSPPACVFFQVNSHDGCGDEDEEVYPPARHSFGALMGY